MKYSKKLAASINEVFPTKVPRKTRSLINAMAGEIINGQALEKEDLYFSLGAIVDKYSLEEDIEKCYMIAKEFYNLVFIEACKSDVTILREQKENIGYGISFAQQLLNVGE